MVLEKGIQRKAKTNRLSPEMPGEEAADHVPQRALLKSLIKELSRQLLQEDTSLRAQIGRVLARTSGSGVLPEVISLDSVEVLLDPLLWIILFAEEKITMLMLRDRLGVPGTLFLAFQNALRQHFGARDGVNAWQEARIQSLLKLFVQFATAYIRYPASLTDTLHEFLAENKSLIEEMRAIVTHLEWDKIRKLCGKKFASRFMLKCKLRSEGFSRHNKSFVSVSSIKGDDAKNIEEPLSECSDDLQDPELVTERDKVAGNAGAAKRTAKKAPSKAAKRRR